MDKENDSGYSEEGKRNILRLYGILIEYTGIVAGVSGGVSIIKNGFGFGEGCLISGGALAFAIGKLYQSFADDDAYAEELLKRGLDKPNKLEKDLSEPKSSD